MVYMAMGRSVRSLMGLFVYVSQPGRTPLHQARPKGAHGLSGLTER